MESQIQPFPMVSAEERIRAFMQRVYTWMTGGLILTGVIAYNVSQSETLVHTLLLNRGIFIALLFAELIAVMALSFLAPRLSSTLAGGLFIAYSALNGLTLSVIFLVYTNASIAQVFFITAGTFGAMSVFGFVTKKDLTSWGSFLFMGLIGIILAAVVNLFIRSDAFSMMISILAVFIFVGLTAYDTQKLKEMALSVEGEAADKPAIVGALILYLDFINLFLNLLRLFGKRR